MSEIIITVDLGTITAYEILRDPLKVEKDRLKTIKGDVAIEPRSKASEKFRGPAGRFYQGGGTSGTTAGFGEQQKAVLETEKRQIKSLAEIINALVLERDCDKWHLAADRSINTRILEQLTPAVKAKLKKNVPANLTKTDQSKIMSYFA